MNSDHYQRSGFFFPKKRKPISMSENQFQMKRTRKQTIRTLVMNGKIHELNKGMIIRGIAW